MIPCRACPRRQRHYRGVVADFEDGFTGVVGIDWGQTRFFGGGVWASMVAAEQRQIPFLCRRRRPGAAQGERSGQ